MYVGVPSVAAYCRLFLAHCNAVEYATSEKKKHPFNVMEIQMYCGPLGIGLGCFQIGEDCACEKERLLVAGMSAC